MGESKAIHAANEPDSVMNSILLKPAWMVTVAVIDIIEITASFYWRGFVMKTTSAIRFKFATTGGWICTNEFGSLPTSGQTGGRNETKD